jgi:hypothetical protein
LALPSRLSLTTARGRRWRDLAVHYSQQLGDERMTREDVRARLRSLIWLTIEFERLQDETICDQPVAIHSVLHMTQEQRALLNELGLCDAPPSDALPSVADYVAADA